MNNGVENPNGDWQACAPGELRHLAEGVRAERRARELRRSALIAAGLILAVAAAWMAQSHFWPVADPDPRGHLFAGVYCDEVRRELPDLLAGRLKPQRAEQLREHVALCAHCQRMLQRLGVEMPLSLDGRRRRDEHCPCCVHWVVSVDADASQIMAAWFAR